MKAYFAKRPWMIILIAQALFMIWWIAFVVFAARRPLLEIEAAPPVHVRR